MTEKTLKYSHQAKCPANKENITTKKIKANNDKMIEPTTQTVSEEPKQEQAIKQSAISVRQERINQRKEAYKQLMTNAF